MSANIMMNLSSSELEVAHQKQQQIKLNPTPLVKKTKTKVKLNDGKRFLNNPYYAGTPLARKNQLLALQQQQAARVQQQQQMVENQPKFFVTPPTNNNNEEPVQPMFAPTSFGQDSFVADQQCPCCGSCSATSSSNSSSNHSFGHGNTVNNNNNNNFNTHNNQSSYTQDNFSFTSQQFLAATNTNEQHLNSSVLSTRSNSSSNHAMQEELEQPVQPQQLQVPSHNNSVTSASSSSHIAVANHNNKEKDFSYAPGTSFVVVMFKHELCTFQCKFFVVEGDWVVVQADRGEHVGRVRSVSQESPAFHVPSHILRHANFAEISSVESNHPHEEAAAQRIQQIVEELQLPNIRVTDTEFYSDGNKMTVFFSSKSTVDFRELQRRVFREFRRRIWLINNAEVVYRNRNCRNRK